MINAKPTTTVIVSHFRLSALDSLSTDEKKKEMEKVSYASVVESLMYLRICTRSGIVFDESLVCHYMANLGKNHREVVK